jgi:hypothetical protein
MAKTTADQRLIFNVQKPVEAPHLQTQNYPFLLKYLSYTCISGPCPCTQESRRHYI